MSYNTTVTRTWTRASDNDGLVFNVEYRRIDSNVSEIMDGLDKAVAYTIQAADDIGILRATNSLTLTAGQAFSAATPSVVSDVGHGLVTGDTIVVSASSATDEVGNGHYVVTKLTDDTFSLDDTVNAAGGGGTLSWRKDLTITLPAAASHTDNIYTIMKVDANEGAVDAFDNDGTNHYYLLSQNDWVLVKSDGTNWVVLDSKITESQANTNKVTGEYWFTEGNEIDIVARVPGAGAAGTILIPELPSNTIAVLLNINAVGTIAEDEIDLKFRRNVGAAVSTDQNFGNRAVGATTPAIRGTLEIRTDGNSFYVTQDANITIGVLKVMAFKVKES